MYRPTNPDTWSGRVDILDAENGYRWHQMIQMADLEKRELTDLKKKQKGVALLGFSSDEGVKRNQGRVGAAQGPRELRKACASFAAHFVPYFKLVDAGDVSCLQGNLEEAHKHLQVHVAEILTSGFLGVVLGGGHEVAYGHFLGITTHLQRVRPTARLGVINIDAHFDLRKRPEGPSSGTPFLQMADWCQENEMDFNYLALGIQEQSNTKALFDTADRLGVEYVFAKEVQMHRWLELEEKINLFLEKVDVVYLTIDLDAFAAPFAPGVSAPAGNGLMPEVVFAIVERLMSSGKVLSADIAELNPVLDIDNRTAKLGAALIYEIVAAYQKL
jgi:formiminoglutamase